MLEFKAADPIFKHFTEDLSKRPTGYYEQNCWIGASFLPPHEGKLRHEIGVDKLMWGSDYPHGDGVWPESSTYIEKQFADLSAEQVRQITCDNAVAFYRLDQCAHSSEAA